MTGTPITPAQTDALAKLAEIPPAGSEELERLSKAATQGKWSVGESTGGDCYLNATGSRRADPCGPGMPWDGFAAFVVEMDEEPFPTGPANAAFVVAIVNAYRAGHLVFAALATGGARHG